MEEDGRNDTAVVHGVKAEGVSIVTDGDSDNNGGGDGPRAAGGRGSGGISKEQRSGIFVDGGCNYCAKPCH